MKETLQTVLVSAQKTGEELKANAEREAELIKRGAEADAEDKKEQKLPNTKFL